MATEPNPDTHRSSLRGAVAASQVSGAAETFIAEHASRVTRTGEREWVCSFDDSLGGAMFEFTGDDMGNLSMESFGYLLADDILATAIGVCASTADERSGALANAREGAIIANDERRREAFDAGARSAMEVAALIRDLHKDPTNGEY